MKTIKFFKESDDVVVREYTPPVEYLQFLEQMSKSGLSEVRLTQQQLATLVYVLLENDWVLTDVMASYPDDEGWIVENSITELHFVKLDVTLWLFDNGRVEIYGDNDTLSNDAVLTIHGALIKGKL